MWASSRCGLCAAVAALVVSPAFAQPAIHWSTTDLLPSEPPRSDFVSRPHTPIVPTSEHSESDDTQVQMVPIPPAAATGGALVAGLFIVRLIRRKQAS